MADKRKSPLFDWENGEFMTAQGRVLTGTEEQAVQQIIIKAQQTARGLYLIYADTENPALNHKYGSDVHDILVRRDLTEEVRISELERAVQEAIIYDPWIDEVYDITIERQGSAEVLASFKVKTVYDKEIEVEGVTLNG
jgi:hypothetical protein